MGPRKVEIGVCLVAEIIHVCMIIRENPGLHEGGRVMSYSKNFPIWYNCNCNKKKEVICSLFVGGAVSTLGSIHLHGNSEYRVVHNPENSNALPKAHENELYCHLN